jgi:hypothetical protein
VLIRVSGREAPVDIYSTSGAIFDNDVIENAGHALPEGSHLNEFT